MIQDAIRSLVNGKSLTQTEAASVAQEIMDGSATSAQISALLVSLRLQGETPAEIAGMAETMRANSIKVPMKSNDPIVDIVGTGGDSMGTFNISTAAIFVVAACGLKVAKHGNRAASGTVGSADILESNGVKLDLSPESVAQCVNEVGVGFMFAPAFHPAMRFAGPTRKEIGIRTIFNILGPLTNPANAQNQVIGCPTEELGWKMANVLNILGTGHSWVTCGADGMDELTLTKESLVWEISNGRIRHFEITPEDAGLERCNLEELRASGPDDHQKLFLSSLSEGKSAAKDIVMLNAAAALVVAKAQPDLRSGVTAARRAIDSGGALEKLDELANVSQKLS